MEVMKTLTFELFPEALSQGSFMLLKTNVSKTESITVLQNFFSNGPVSRTKSLSLKWFVNLSKFAYGQGKSQSMVRQTIVY